MEVADSESERTRAWFKEREGDPWLAMNRRREPERVSGLREAIDSFVEGGALGDFAIGYQSPFGAGFEPNLLKEVADRLSADTAVAVQLRDFVRTPKGDEQAATKINRFVDLVDLHRHEGTLSPNGPGPGYAPVVLAACWHAQEPDRWQPYTASGLKALEALAPSACRRYGKGDTHGERCVQFERALMTVGSGLGIDLRDLAVMLARPAATPKPTPSTADTRYWLMWLGPKSSLWDECYAEGVAAIDFDRVGRDLRHYGSRKELEQCGLGTNDSLACWQFCREMKPDDVILVAKDRTHVLGHGIVKSDYRFDGGRPRYRHLRKVEWRSRTPPDGVWASETLASKALTDVTAGRKLVDEILRALDPFSVAPEPVPSRYTLDEAASEIFLNRADLERLAAQLERKKNLVLQGPPGTGKTFIAQRLAWLQTEERSRDRTEFVQFHQSYGYEDFVRGFRPTREGGFELQDGPFLRFCDRAREDSGRPFVLVIDEINRGNLSRIFGELLMLIEADKRSPEWAVRLAYSRDGEERFQVPENVFLIGTMNTADRSLALVDYALRRRFAFWTVDPAFGEEKFMQHMLDQGVPESIRLRIRERLNDLNQKIEKDKDLGRGFRIGHSYFCERPTGDDVDWGGWYREIVDYEIRPLLEEYWFDQPESAEKAAGDLQAPD